MPVFGIAESAFAMALNYGQRFGVIAILPVSVTRQERYVTQLGLGQRYAASQAVGLGVTELEGPSTGARLEAVGRELVETQGADVLILGLQEWHATVRTSSARWVCRSLILPRRRRCRRSLLCD